MSIINKSKIAILLTTYNGERFLSEQIDSIINQSYQDWTLYINDDGSNDSTTTIIKQFSLKFNKIIDLSGKFPSRQGAMKNFLNMLECIESRYYMFSDQDDLWFPDKIESSLKVIEKQEIRYKNLPIIIHSNVNLMDEYGNVFIQDYWKHSNYFPDKFKDKDLILFSNCVQGATMLFNYQSKKASYPIPIAAHKLMHDSWISYSVLSAGGHIESIYNATMSYRQHDSNVFGFKYGKKLKLYYRIRKLRKIIYSNFIFFSLLKQIGYGSFYKAFKNKLVVTIILHIENKFAKYTK